MTQTTAIANRLLARLPPDEYEQLRPHLERVELVKGKILYEVGSQIPDGFFLLNGLVCLLARTEQDETVEVAMVGNEGIVGLPAVFNATTAPHEAMVAIGGSAWRIKSDVLRREFRRGTALQEVLLQDTLSLLGQFAQSAVCHRFHTTLQRLSRWLLMTRDRVDADSLEVTQEFIAYLLGIQRTYVNAAALELQDADLIRYRHGKITILNRRRLERAACECYHLARK